MPATSAKAELALSSQTQVREMSTMARLSSITVLLSKALNLL